MAVQGEQIYFKSGAFGNYSVHVKGLKSILTWLKTADPKLEKAMKKALKESGTPVLQKARANASSIADDGTLQSSLALGTKSGKGTFQVVLKSSDPAAGVKEFAHLGARYTPKSSDKRQNARKMGSFPVGVPRRAYAPRVMVPAVNDSSNEVQALMEAAIDAVLKEAGRG